MNRLAILFVWAAFALLAACTRQEQPEVSAIEKVNDSTVKISPDGLKNLKIEKAILSEIPERLDLMGRVSVTEDRTTVIPARVAGRIDSIYLASGETVKKDQPLLSLFSPDFVSAREEYVQSLKQARIVSSDGTNSDFGTFSKLARKRLETMGLNDEDINAISTDTSNNPNLIVRSPRSGVIVDKKAILGNLVNVGDNLFTVADINKVWFSGDLYSEDLPKVRKNQDVVIDDIPGGQPIYGRISFISPIVDPTARTIKLRALMDNPKGLLRGDMYVHGGIILSKKKALLIPTAALIRSGATDFVYVRSGANMFKRVAVSSKEESNNMTSILSGVVEGDEVITDGALFLEAALGSVGT